MQHTTSCGQNILDTQVNGPYTASNEKKVLIKIRHPSTAIIFDGRKDNMDSKKHEVFSSCFSAALIARRPSIVVSI